MKVIMNEGQFLKEISSEGEILMASIKIVNEDVLKSSSWKEIKSKKNIVRTK